VLWTNDAARAGFTSVPGFTLTREAPHRALGHDFVEQTWSLRL
jgi:hypothetical protein